MSIFVDEKKRIFKLDSKNASYVISVVDKEGFVGQAYYGAKIADADVAYMLKTADYPWTPERYNRERVPFMDYFAFEYAGYGSGDYRPSCVEICDERGATAVNPVYKSFKLHKGKPELEGGAAKAGMPAVFASEDECQTLELILEDAAASVELSLYYTVFDDLDAIIKSVCIRNTGKKDFFVTKLMSSSMTLENEPSLDIISLPGAWARERRIQRQKVMYGSFKAGSNRGISSNQSSPFMAVAESTATQREGNVWGFSLIYSGNHEIEAFLNANDSLRVTMGIGSDGFSWKLSGGEFFASPEAALVYSGEGLGGMSRTYHDLYRGHIIRSKYKFMDRPVLLNSWEAAYFDFDTEKLLGIAREAAARKVELFVLDDGWFGKRNNDDCSLGDWYANEEKIPGGLERLGEEVHKLGMKFGVWFEPEMVNPDSDLYRAHPDWALHVDGRTISESRHQLVLDYSRKEVRDFIYGMISSLVRSAGIDYIKWDMNRNLTEVWSAALPADRQGEVFHRYVLGVYDIMNRLVTDFPDLLFENCSSGGARFDAGMLYYSPQIWCSDDTDAVERLAVQEGTALVFPLSTMGAHVSVCPNHVTARSTPFETRAMVALAGTFGYELDMTKLSDADKNAVPQQIAAYHRFGSLMREGDYYRLQSYRENNLWDSWMVVAKDKKTALVTVVQVMTQPSRKSRRLRFEGLDSEKQYSIEVVQLDKDTPLHQGAEADRDEFAGRTFSGSTLMNAGIMVHRTSGDFQGTMYCLTAK